MTVSVNGVLIDQETEGDITIETLADGRLALRINGIAAKNLDTLFEIAVTDGSTTSTYNYSALTYAYNTQNKTTISKALYNYYEKAADYLG